jgi:hypothetical protein
MDYQDSNDLPQDISPKDSAPAAKISQDPIVSNQVEDSQLQDQETTEIIGDSSTQQDSGLHDFVDMMGLELDEQDPVSAFHHHEQSGDHSQESADSDENTLEAEVIEAGDGGFFNQECNPEKNRTMVGISRNGLAKAAVVIGGTLAVFGGGATFFNGQIPKDKVAKVQKAKTPADEKVNAAESAATKAQQSESETKAELALSKQKDSLDQASKNDSAKAAADNKPTVSSTTPSTTATVGSLAKSNPSTTTPARTASSSPAVPVVPFLRPASSDRFANSTPVSQPAKPKPAKESQASNSSIASAQLPSSIAAKPAPASKPSGNASLLQTTTSRSPIQLAAQNAYTPTSFPKASSSKKTASLAILPSVKRGSRLAIQPLPTPGLNRSEPSSDSAEFKSIPNSFGSPANGSATSSIVVASTTNEDTATRSSTKSLSDYLGSKSKPQLQVVAAPGFTSTPYSNGFVSNNTPTPLYNAPGTGSDPTSLASGIRSAQGATIKTTLPALSDVRSDSTIIAVSVPPSLSDGINKVQGKANATPAINQFNVASQPQPVNQPNNGIDNSSGLLSLAAGIRTVQELPNNGRSFQVASANIDDPNSLDTISTRPAFKNSQLIALKSADKADKASKVDAVKPLSNTFNIAKSILVGTSAKGSTLTPILWNGGASSSAKFIIKLDEAIPDNSGQMALPSGSQLVVIAKTVSNSLALADLEVVSVIINGTEYTAPIGAITVRDDNNGLLIGEDYFRRNEQTAGRDFLSVLTNAASSVGQALNRPTSTFSFNGLGGSTTVSNQGRDILGAALEGGFRDLPAIWTQRNQQALQEIASKPNVYQISKGKAVRIFINRTIDF